MASFQRTVFAVVATAATFVASAPGPFPPIQPRDYLRLSELNARQGGFRVQNWGNEGAQYDFVRDTTSGEWSVEWDQGSGENFVVGLGYQGQDMLFNYTGEFEVDGNAYLCLYGWTREPLAEYYVIENFGSHHPSDNANSTCHGTFETDGATYEVWDKWRVNAPSIEGEATFQQYWSIRTKRHIGGTISTGNHFAAFEAAGLPLGAQQGMFLAIEGQQGSGEATVTVGVAPTTTVAETETPTTRTQRPQSTNTCTATLEI